jgi:hypothetical protein
MATMNRLRERLWIIVAVLAAVFLMALSMHVERWGFFLLCLIVGSLAGLGLIFARDQTVLFWSQLPKSRRRIAIATAVPLILVVTFASNHHKPNEFANDAALCFGLIIASLLWGLASLMSRLVNALHTRLSKR